MLVCRGRYVIQAVFAMAWQRPWDLWDPSQRLVLFCSSEEDLQFLVGREIKKTWRTICPDLMSPCSGEVTSRPGPDVGGPVCMKMKE